MGLFNVFSENYLEWDEYQELISERDHINFIHNTAIQSLKNRTSKEAEDNEH